MHTPVARPPLGSVKRLEELTAGGSRLTVGTLVLITPGGLALTARHCVVWDGIIYPHRLRVAEDDVKLVHVVSFPDLDISVVQLLSREGGSSSIDSGSSSGRIESGSGGHENEVRPRWPYVDASASQELVPGE